MKTKKNVIEEVLRKSSVFKEEDKLSIDYIPPYLPHREEDLKKLSQYFRRIIEKPGSISQRVMITGGVGTGKTAISKLFGKLMEDAAIKRNINLHYLHINCRKAKTNSMILKYIIRKFNPRIPERGFSKEELLFMFEEIIKTRDAYLIIALDELDFLLKKSGSDIIYDLTRLGDEKLNCPQRLSLIVIVRDTAFRSGVDLSTLSTLQHNIINLEKYTTYQLKEILRYRIKEAFYENTASEEAVNLIADISAEWGDARYAIELLWRAGKYVDMEQQFIIHPEHVRKAKADTHPSVRREILRDISLHHNLLLLAISRQLRISQAAYATMGETKEKYNIICEEYGEKPKKHTQIWEYIQDLENYTIISTKISGSGVRGKTTLIGLPDVPTSVLEQEIIEFLEEKKYDYE